MGTATAFASSNVTYVGGTADTLGVSSGTRTEIFDAYMRKYGNRVFSEPQARAPQKPFAASEDDIKLFDSALFATFERVYEID